MNIIDDFLQKKQEMQELIENIEGAEVKVKDFEGTVMFIHQDMKHVTVYLEDEEGENWEETMTLKKLSEHIKKGGK